MDKPVSEVDKLRAILDICDDTTPLEYNAGQIRAIIYQIINEAGEEFIKDLKQLEERHIGEKLRVEDFEKLITKYSKK